MADKINFDHVFTEEMLMTDDVMMLTLTVTESYFGVLAGHAPVISTLRPGVIDVKDGESGDMRIFVRGGFAEVDPKKVVVLAEEAVPLEGLDVEALEQRIRDTEEDLTLAKTDAERARVQETLDYLRQLRAAV